MRSAVDLQALAAAYLRGGRQGHEEAQHELSRMLTDDPDAAWEFVQAAIDAARTVDDLGSIGAGAVEDLLRHWGGRFNDDLIAKAKSDARWAYAARMLRDTPGAQEAADAAEAAWADFHSLLEAAEASLRGS
jgi:Family of unknown function (DUF6869)